MSKLSPSILSADFANLGNDAVTVSKAGADYLHIDVMDGHFVPNISFGSTVMKSLDGLDTAPYDVHLMIENPDRYIEDFLTEKTEYIVVHQEACNHLNRTVEHIKSTGVKAGVALNPATPIDSLYWIMDRLDLVLIMSVNPGFGGQKFIENSLEKIRTLNKIRADRKLNFAIEVDGGVNLNNLSALKTAGTDIFVAGSAIFSSGDVTSAVEDFRKVIL